ncbi:MAG TPA: hypothetical protein VL463_34825 [Kofleriaceae bacterium]|nr:hypothetical protein [Kofleriaceae bacterium]
MRAPWLFILFAACQSANAPAGGKLELVDAPKTADVAPYVARELARANADHKQLLVYVGASWCEPCTHFHEAAAKGELDATFPTLRLLVFDDDRDHEALARAGYESQLIPLFVVPAADGRATGRHIEGSVKGTAAVGEITPRLRALLDN